MLALRLLAVTLCATGLLSAADAGAVAEAANRLDQQAAKAPQTLALEFRLRAAQALEQRHSDLARRFVDNTLKDLRARSWKPFTIRPELVSALTQAAPSEAAVIVPEVAPELTEWLILELARTNHVDAALALYRDSFSRGRVKADAAHPLLSPLVKEKPAEAARLFQEMVAGVPFDSLIPNTAWRLLNSTRVIATVAPQLAADTCERILATVSAKDYGRKFAFSATFQVGSATVETANARDSLLLAAGARLQALAPERLEKYKPLLAKWDLSAPVTVRGFRNTSGARPTSRPQSILRRMGQMRGLPTDTDRARLAITLAGEIRALRAGELRVNFASDLCNLSTEGDLGAEALTAVATTLGLALRKTRGGTSDYLELASLARYEHVPVSLSDPAYDTAVALLELREQLLQETGFTLAALDGQTYHLDALRGRVVLLNFWATWCPPCRREMPDMEKLYQRFAQKGLLVLAVSDEERDTVTGFLAKQNYTFPVLLDPGRKVHSAFNVEGIPKSFLFDRGGKLVAQAIDMRTEAQFLAMLKQAGLE